MCRRSLGLLFSKSVETFKKKRWMIGETETGDQSVVNQLIIKTNKWSPTKKRKPVQLKVYKSMVKLLNMGLTLVALSPHSHQRDACCNVGYFTGLQTKLPSLRTLYFTCFPWSLFAAIMSFNGRQVLQRVTLGSSTPHGVDIKSGLSLRHNEKVLLPLLCVKSNGIQSTQHSTSEKMYYMTVRMSSDCEL